jgi:hypothetical protein
MEMLTFLGVSDFKYYPNNLECSDIYTGIPRVVDEALINWAKPRGGEK